MKLQTSLGLVLTFAMVTLGHGQQPRRPPEAAVAEFLERQGTSTWQPDWIFDNCVIPGPWEQEAFRLLATADLSRFQRTSLAIAWGSPFRECNDPALNAWYFGQIEAGMRDGTPSRVFDPLWRALGDVDSPPVRDFLWRITTDEAAPSEYRESAGRTLFARFDDEELRREYFRVFATRQLPMEVAWFYTSKLIRIDAGRTLRQMADLIRQDPHLAH